MDKLRLNNTIKSRKEGHRAHSLSYLSNQKRIESTDSDNSEKEEQNEKIR